MPLPHARSRPSPLIECGSAGHHLRFRYGFTILGPTRLFAAGVFVIVRGTAISMKNINIHIDKINIRCYHP